MSDHNIDWSQIRPAPWPDADWRDTISGEEVERLRRELVAAQSTAQRSSRQKQELPSFVTAELRKLTASVEAMRALSPPLLLPIPDAAKLLEVSVSTVRRGIRDGSIPHRRIGRSVRIDIGACKGIDGATVAALAREARGLASK